MKKRALTILVVAALVLSAVIPTLLTTGSYAAAAAAPVSVTTADGSFKTEITAGASASAGLLKPKGGTAFWGNHESRIVHTSHGDYAAYCVDQIEGTNGLLLTGFALFKITGNTSRLIFNDYKAFEASGVTAFADRDDNVWVVEVGDSRLKSPSGKSAVHMTAYRIDAATDDVVSYSATYYMRQKGSGFGYGSAAYDEYSNAIIAETADGDPSSGADCGTINWFIFNLDSLLWEKNAYQADVGNRYCYPYIIPDRKGGMYIIAGRDYKCTSAGYPEIGDHTLPAGESMSGYFDQKADYVWDSIHFFYVPDIRLPEIARIAVEEADYSKVTGTAAERRTLAKRLTNIYPNFQNNNGGDVYLDTKGYLHIIWCKQYLYAASTRAEADNIYYHYVYDVRNMTDLGELTQDRCISKSPITNGAVDKKNYSFRLYEDTKGSLYYISGSVEKQYTETTLPQNIKSVKPTTSTITVYSLSGTPSDGYTCTPIAVQSNRSGQSIVNISNRGSYIIDNKVAAIIESSASDYRYFSISLTNNTSAIECTHTNYSIETVREATTTAAGLAYRVCNDCGYRKPITLPMLVCEHVYSSVGTVTLAPERNTYGIMSYPCTGCNVTREVQIPRLGDANDNGTIDATDLLSMKLVIFNLSTVPDVYRPCLDVDKSGTVNGTDVFYIKYVIFHGVWM